MAFEERRRGSIINPHFLLQIADATLTAFSAKPAAGKAVRTRPGNGPSSPKGLRALEQGTGASATRTFPARPDQVQSPKRWDKARPEELREPRESLGESSTQTRASTDPRLGGFWAVGPSGQNRVLISKHGSVSRPSASHLESKRLVFGTSLGEMIKINDL